MKINDLTMKVGVVLNNMYPVKVKFGISTTCNSLTDEIPLCFAS